MSIAVVAPPHTPNLPYDVAQIPRSLIVIVLRCAVVLAHPATLTAGFFAFCWFWAAWPNTAWTWVAPSAEPRFREVTGVVLYGNHRDGEPLDVDEEDLLTGIARAASTAYEHLRVQELEQWITELQAQVRAPVAGALPSS